MRLQLIPLLIFIFFSVGVDYYIARTLASLKSRWPLWLHIILSVVLIVMVVVAINLPFRNGSNTTLLFTMWTIFTYLSVYLPKFLYVVVGLASQIPQLFGRHRLAWLSKTGAVIAAIVFLSFWWGALVERFNIDVKEVDVELTGLPAGFDGYRIVQISDFHVGTYGNDTTYVAKVVETINSLHPDMIVFTGDIVNSVSSELEPHAAPLSRLHAPDGVFSILGNHDYGDYSDWDTPADKKANLQKLIDLQRAMGWDLLLNEHRFVAHGNDSIAVIGVENIGDPPFHVYGSLHDSYPDLGDSTTKILLSHNPAHWTDSIAENADMNIALTLAGHTHAMQIEVAGFSPAVWRYPTWGGLYQTETTQNKLYVNIGVGTVGLPSRIGATPEITLLTLKKKN